VYAGRSAEAAATGAGAAEPPPGPYSLDFADTDIRDAVTQILGGLLRANFTIDPAVHGSVTLHTVQPLSGRQLLPTLQTLLANAGAVMVPEGGLLRIIPAASANAVGSAVVPLRFVSADDLAKVLQPLAGPNTRIAAEAGLNALLVSGDPAQIQAVRDLVRSFDVDELLHQSYALLPVDTGNAHDFADAMQGALRAKADPALAGLVRIVPLTRLNAILVVSSQPRYIDAARQVYALVERARRSSVRSWHVIYLQTSNADDIAYTLQSAFTPNNVTAVPQAQKQSAAGGGGAGSLGGSTLGGSSLAGSGGLATAGGGVGAGLGSGQSFNAAGSGVSGTNPLTPAAGTVTGGNRPSGAAAPANPLLGGLEPGAGEDTADSLRILPNAQNNAVLIYATPQEAETIQAMLNKIDVMPVQVRIDATIAEVTLNDNLQYGTQFFFKSGGINGILNTATAAVGNPAATVLGTSFPGFLLGGNGQGGAPLAISALQAVTTVNVLSSPQITVIDNQQARLQVGSLVPYLTASSQSTVTSGAPIVNSVAYQPTGVILSVTPRVNASGLVTLDVSQEVSDVNSATTTSGISSPTFDERAVSTRVVLQDGQTVGLAGLIQDSISRGNQGIPWLKDIPILGVLAGTQTNTRTRTELLVLITPHVIRSANDMRKLTDDIRDGLAAASAVPLLSAREPVSGSDDPNRRVRQGVRRALSRDVEP
jgi:general secretion pathway protein D